MKTLFLALAILGFATAAQAGQGCSGTNHDQTAENPPPSEPTT